MAFPFVILCNFLQAAPAKEPSPLDLGQFLTQVDRNFPKLVSVRLESGLAQSKAQEKRGAFDPVLSINSDVLRYNPSSAPGKAYETQMSEGVIDILDRSGAKLQVGARLNNGRVKSPGTSTGAWGEYFVSAKIPLIRDQLNNAKSIAERQSLLGIPIADQFIREVRFDILTKAGGAYWDWVGSGAKLRISEDLLRLAKDRAEYIRKRVEAGSNPPIDNAEATAEVFRRVGALEKSERDLQKAEFKLQVFRWSNDLASLQVEPRSSLPKITQTVSELTDDQLKQGVDAALQERPELLAIRLGRDVLSLDLELARNSRKPALDLAVGPGVDLGQDGIGATYKMGVFYSIPLRQNTADGLIRQTQLKLSKLELEERLTRQGIEIEVRDSASAVRAAEKRVRAAESEVQATRELERGETIRFREGASTLFLVNQRERARAEAEARLVDVIVEYEQAKLSFGVTTTNIQVGEMNRG